MSVCLKRNRKWLWTTRSRSVCMLLAKGWTEEGLGCTEGTVCLHSQKG